MMDPRLSYEYGSALTQPSTIRSSTLGRRRHSPARRFATPGRSVSDRCWCLIRSTAASPRPARI
jgi:hypothetical protein